MSEIATENVTADDGNVVPLRPGGADAAPRAAAEQPQAPPRNQEDAPRRKRRTKPLANNKALAWVREKGEVTVGSYAALGLVWGWERSRTSKAVKAWQEAGKVTVEQAGGKITIRIVAQDPSAPAGKLGPAEREIPPREEREIHVHADRENGRESEREIDSENARPFTEVERETAQPIPAREAAPAAPVQQPPAASVPAPAAHGDIGIVGTIYLLAATLAALGLEIVPVYFAIKGFVGLMPREPDAALALAIVLDGAKMAAVGFLSALWDRLSWLVRILLGVGIGFTAAISAFSVYTQIVASHTSDATVASADAAAVAAGDVMRLEATVFIQRRAVADARRELELHDEAVEKAMAAKPKSATQTKSDGDKRRAPLAEKLEKTTKHLEDLEGQKAQATVQERQIAVHRNAESAPLAYLARWLGFDASDPDQVFSWQAAAIVLCADPFALLLIWAVASVKRRRRP